MSASVKKNSYKSATISTLTPVMLSTSASSCWSSASEAHCGQMRTACAQKCLFKARPHTLLTFLLQNTKIRTTEDLGGCRDAVTLPYTNDSVLPEAFLRSSELRGGYWQTTFFFCYLIKSLNSNQSLPTVFAIFSERPYQNHGNFSMTLVSLMSSDLQGSRHCRETIQRKFPIPWNYPEPWSEDNYHFFRGLSED